MAVSQHDSPHSSSRSWLAARKRTDRRLWLWLAVVSVISFVVVGRFVFLVCSGRLTPVKNVEPGTAPTVKLAEAQGKIEQVKLKQREVDRGIASVEQALYLLIESPSTERRRSGVQVKPGGSVAREDWYSNFTIDQEAALAYLSTAKIPPQLRRAVVNAVLHDAIDVHAITLQLLAQHGEDEDGRRLKAKTPPTRLIGPWLDLLVRWKTPPDDAILLNTLAKRQGDVWAKELVQRGFGDSPTIVEALAKGSINASAAYYLEGAQSEADYAALRAIRQARAKHAITRRQALRLVKHPPHEALNRTLRAEIKKQVNSPSTIDAWLPALVVFDDSELWDDAASSANRGIKWSQMRNNTQKNILTKLTHRSLLDHLMWELERHPSEGAARLLRTAVSESHKAEAVPTPIRILLARRPDLGSLAAFRELAVQLDGRLAPESAGSLDQAGPADAKTIEDAMKVLRVGRKVQAKALQAALLRLAAVKVDADLRARVVRAIQPWQIGDYRTRGPRKEARLAFCHWAGPGEHAALAKLATKDEQPEVQSAALSTLLAQRSVLSLTVARRHADEGWSSDAASLWRQSGPLAEPVLCRVIAEKGMRNGPAWLTELLGEIGGARARAIIQAMLAAPSDDADSNEKNHRQVLQAALKKIDDRLNHSDELSPAKSQTDTQQP